MLEVKFWDDPIQSSSVGLFWMIMKLFMDYFITVFYASNVVNIL